MQRTGGSTLPGLPPLAAQPSRWGRPLEIVEIVACGRLPQKGVHI